METKKISVEQAIDLIKKDQYNSKYKIDFTNKKIDAFDAILLGKNGVDVPDELIEYNDDKIDYSDIPPITDDDIDSGKIKWTISTELALEKEIADWIKRENINVGEFAANLIRNFYKGMKSLPKNAAL